MSRTDVQGCIFLGDLTFAVENLLENSQAEHELESGSLVPATLSTIPRLGVQAFLKFSLFLI